MTWLTEKTGPQGSEREQLLAERAALVKQIEDLKKSPLPRGDATLQARFRLEDLKKIASLVVKIDAKLGRHS